MATKVKNIKRVKNIHSQENNKIIMVNNIKIVLLYYYRMSSTISVPDDNKYINIKMYILDPLSIIVKLAILSNKPIGTKLLIKNNIIYFQEPGPFQSITRMVYNSNKTDLQYIYNPINVACLHFLSKSFVEKTPRIKQLFLCAQAGIKKLMETYKACSIITITLNYYYSLLTNHINQTYNDTLFVKDNLTCYYTQYINDSFNKHWSDEKIKVVLDIITFLGKNENPNNVKSLETIMEDIDKRSQTILADIF
jgi:hypothetical protein